MRRSEFVVLHANVLLVALMAMAVSSLTLPSCFADDDTLADPSYSQELVEEVLDDRPKMRRLWDQSTCFQYFIFGLLSGTSSELHWDSSEPFSGRTAESEIASDGSKLIRLTKSEKAKGADLWFDFVFEINNSNQSKSFEELRRKASRGLLSEKEFVNGCVAIELRALARSKEFFANFEKLSGETFNSEVFKSAKRLPSDVSVQEYYAYLGPIRESDYDPRAYFGDYFRLFARNRNHGTETGSLSSFIRRTFGID